jgi:hypothetical protein
MQRPLLMRRGAWFVLVLWILNGVMPAFASPGTWICPDGTTCPWMNGGRPSQSAQAMCQQNGKRSCCRCPIQRPSAQVSSTQECRFIPNRTLQAIARLVAVEPTDSNVPAQIILPVTVHDLLDCIPEASQDPPLPSDTALPPPSVATARASRAPPLA